MPAAFACQVDALMRGRLRGRGPITGTDPRVAAAKRLNQDRTLGIAEVC